MPRRSRRIKRNKQSGNKFGDLPRKCVVDVLMNFDIYKVASNHRVVCREFRDAGQDRINERGGRKLFEEAMEYCHGLNNRNINIGKSIALMDAAMYNGCKMALLVHAVTQLRVGEEDKNNLFKRFKNIALLELDIQYHVQGYGEFFVGCLIGRGNGNKNKQAEWYTKSAELGNALAMNKLGTCYAEGTGGLAASRTKAIELFTTSAKAGCAAARSNLAELILSKERADGFATFDGLQLMLQSAQQGFDNAQYQIGLLSGGLHVVWTFDVVGLAELVPVDHEVSFTWSLAAAENPNDGGHAGAMHSVGYALEFGIGVEEDEPKAVEGYRKSANKGYGMSAFRLGDCYELGDLGLEIDLVQALFWYQAAASQGNEEALEAIRERFE